MATVSGFTRARKASITGNIGRNIKPDLVEVFGSSMVAATPARKAFHISVPMRAISTKVTKKQGIDQGQGLVNRSAEPGQCDDTEDPDGAIKGHVGQPDPGNTQNLTIDPGLW